MNSDFGEKIVKLLEEHNSLTTQEIYSLFGDMNAQTVSWHLHKQTAKGNIVQASHGRYCLPVSSLNDRARIEKLPPLSRTAFEILSETDYDFYLSGLDSLNGDVFSVNSTYPVIICTSPQRIKDVQLELMRQSDFAITEDEVSLLSNSNLIIRIQYVLLKSSAMDLSKDCFALPEKAFVDLYYCVTRLDYPIDMSELPHILSLLKPNPFRFRTATKDRGLSDELNFLLCYSAGFIRNLAKYL
ncbi:MAG: hypothetical protein MJ052_05430 [Sphaerochaetaceae bacterium]|nr:hypothetical protein [Sphaerochaetaceae bacterium]